MIGQVVLACTLSFALALAGCSSDSDDPSPAEKCSELGQSVCQSNSSCAVETGAIAKADQNAYVSNCVAGFKQALDCSRVTKVTGNPDTCEVEVAATPCEQFDPNTGLPLPASCRSIFQ